MAQKYGNFEKVRTKYTVPLTVEKTVRKTMSKNIILRRRRIPVVRIKFLHFLVV